MDFDENAAGEKPTVASHKSDENFLESTVKWKWAGNLEEANDIIREFEVKTTTKFTLYTTDKNFGNTDPTCKMHKVYWKDEIIPFDCSPFIHLASKVLECQHGKDRNAGTKRKRKELSERNGDFCFKKKRNLVQDTKKMDCPAKILMKEVMFFPKYKICEDTEKRRKTQSKKLREHFSNTPANMGERRICIQLPAMDSHLNHPTGEASGIQQPVDPRIKQKIHHLVGRGVNDVNEMRRHLQEFLRVELFPGRELPPSTNRRFFPTATDVRNHIYIATVKQRFSKCDQKNVKAKLAEWQQEYPGDKFLFRPYADVVPESEMKFENGASSQDDEDVKVTTAASRQRLLYVHQTQWQRRLLNLYGNDICLLDATHKTTRYALPLFFLAVRTNVDYQVVGSFVVQDESTDSIKEALAVLREWNPSWNPRFFMTDYSEEEINAVEETFEGCVVYLCDFHREQTWERWANKTDHGFTKDKEELLARLRRIARANTPEKFQSAVDDLKASALWTTHPKCQTLRDWLEHKWLKQYKRWVWAFRQEGFTLRVNTNNGLERQNKVLKYSYLAQHKSNSLSGMLTVMMEEYLPDSYNRYVERNVRCNQGYRRYNLQIPQFLINRPRDVINHCMNRWSAAQEIKSSWITPKDLTRGIFNVRSQTECNKTYSVQFGYRDGLPHCDCQDWGKTYLLCKHFFAVFQHYPEWQWNKLSEVYQQSPYLKLDAYLMCQFTPQTVQPASDSNHSSMQPSEDTGIQNADGDSSPPQETFLPLASRHARPRSEGAKCRELLNQLRSMTYQVEGQACLSELQAKLVECMEDLKIHVPEEDGLLLENPPTAKQAPKSSGSESLLSLPQRKGKNKYSGRVGEVASIMKKSINCKLPVQTPADGACKSAHNQQNVNTSSETQVPQPMDVDSSDGDVDTRDNEEIQYLGKGTCTTPKRKERHLTPGETERIINSNMLTDISVNLAQNILHEEFPDCGGLEDTVLGPLLMFSISRCPFVQILHTNALHWIAVSNIGCPQGHVKVYDSLNTGHVNNHVKKQIATIMWVEDPELTINIQPVQQQHNGTDCGVLAIAYLTSLLHGQDPTTAVYNPNRIRPHLLHCLRQGQLTPFPALPMMPDENTVVTNVDKCQERELTVKLFCSCRMPWFKADANKEHLHMAECDACEEWFHRSCEDIPDVVFTNNTCWNCSACIARLNNAQADVIETC